MRLRLSEFIENQHVILARLLAVRNRPPLPRADTHDIHFRCRLSRLQVHRDVGRIKSMKNPNDPIGYRIRNLPVSSAVLQPTAPLHASPPPPTSYLSLE